MEQFFTQRLPTLSESDTTLLLGDKLADLAAQYSAAQFKSISAVDWEYEEPDTGAEQVTYLGDAPLELFSDKELWKAVRDELRTLTGVRPSARRDAYENIGYLLPILQRVIDLNEREEKGVARLFRGLSFSDLLLVLNSYGAQASPVELSAALDELIDRGMLVPQLVHDSEQRLVRRVFRSGEAVNSDTTIKAKSIIHQLLKERAEFGLPTLSEFGFSKTFATLKKLFPNEMPYRVRPHTFGAEAYMGPEPLRIWAEEHQVIRLSREEIEGVKRERVNALDLPHTFPAWPMPHTIQYSIKSAFQNIANLDQLTVTDTGSVSGRLMLLLLSTCYTHQATFNACAYEIQNWMRRPHYNFDRLLSVLESVNWQKLEDEALRLANSRIGPLFARSAPVPDGLEAAKTELLEKYAPHVRLSSLLQQCRGYLSEYQVKNTVFNDQFDAIKAALADYFGKNQERKMFWRDVFETSGYLNGDKDHTFEKLFIVINPLEAAAWRLMDIVEAALGKWGWQFGGVASADSNDGFVATVTGAIGKYNLAIDQMRVLGVEVGRLHHFRMDSVTSDLNSLVRSCRERFLELKGAFEVRFPIYDEASDMRRHFRRVVL